jgi:hypothetical protein
MTRQTCPCKLSRSPSNFPWPYIELRYLELKSPLVMFRRSLLNKSFTTNWCNAVAGGHRDILVLILRGRRILGVADW